jgi:SAM-dependent methyltransferase
LSETQLDRKSVAKEIAFGLGLAAATYVVAALLGSRIEAPSLRLLAVFAPPIFVAFHWSRANPIRSAVAIAAVLLFGMHDTDDTIVAAHASRGFYGVLRYGEDPSRKFRVLVDGRTIHGRQTLDDAGRREPLSYYHPTGPAGDVLSEGDGPRSLERPKSRVALIGLGAAALAAYAKTGEHWTFFEINPEVVAIANRHFTYLADARTRAKVDVEVGDGRLLLKDLPEHSVDILVLDAFSSDAVPMHLLTKDALAVYRRALEPDGLILANVSNLVLRLQLVLGALAREAGIGALERIDTRVSPELRAKGKDGSEWVLLSENPDVKREGWTPIVTPPSQAVWTDDFVNVFGVLR